MAQSLTLDQNPISGNQFKLKPLTACIRVLIAGGLLSGYMTTSFAELPVPLPVPVPGSGFATSGAATNQVIGDTLRIDQQTERAILNWQSFNVDKDKTVQFAQPSSSSIALNRIHEETNPSRILGTITANGQIYLVNKNGFVFDKGSVVNANTLVATALNISDEVFNRGIVREFEKDTNPGKPALDGITEDSKTAVNPDASIEVKEGAKIVANKNGSIILAAPKVINSGSITTDKQSQILLVASKDKVYLQPASSDSPFSGLLVEVGAGGEVKNTASGEISARQGNITLAGFAVNQEGRIRATTSVNVNGSVRLLARQSARDEVFLSKHALKPSSTERSPDLTDGLGEKSKVKFGANSTLEILPDVEGGSAIDGLPQKQSYVEVSANQIHLETGSSIVAPYAKANFTATNNLDSPLAGTSGRIQLDSGSRIDVSGTKNVNVAMERNVADISVQSFNLRDQPIQRGGVLQGETVKVDIRKNTKIVDASSGKDSISRSIDERLGYGGEINLSASGDIIVNSGALADISGGSINYQGGFVNTTKLISSTGRIVDISNADPNERYEAIYGVITKDYRKWGVTETWNALGQLGTAQFEQGYVEGKAGGSINIQSPLLTWNGKLNAGSINSVYQNNNPVSGGTFSFNVNNLTTPEGAIQYLSSQDVLFQTGQPFLANSFNDKFPKRNNEQANELVLSSSLVNQSGISKINVKTGGQITVSDDVSLSLPVHSELSLEAPNINIDGAIYSAGGTIQLNGVNTGVNESGKINLSKTSTIDVSGRWVNNYQQDFVSSLNDPIVINGGTVNIFATRALNFDKGATIKADGGAHLDSGGSKLTAGRGGTIKLEAGVPAVEGVLRADGNLSAYSLDEGGSLLLASNKIKIGSGVVDDSSLNLGVSDGHFDLTPANGFKSLKLKSTSQDITFLANTDLSLNTQNWILAGNYQNQASTQSIAGFSQINTLPEHLRKPFDLAIEGLSGVTMETGSSIRADKESSIDISSTILGKGIYIDGLLDAKAGSIDISLKADRAINYDPAQSIWLGSHAFLTAQGTNRFNPIDVFGRTQGQVLDGGIVTLNAERGYVVMEQGSVIDVSGTQAKLDLPVSEANGIGVLYSSREIGSDAGKLAITAAEGIALDGDLHANAGSTMNRGGRFDLTLNRNNRSEDFGFYPVNALAINVHQADKQILDSEMRFGSIIPDSLNGQVTVSSDELAKAGFDDLHLNLPAQFDILNQSAPRQAGEVHFYDDVNLNTASSIYIDAQKIGWSGLNNNLSGTVNINTKFLQLGSSTTGDNSGVSELGGGVITSQTDWTQLIGASLYSGFNQVNFQSNHDLRALGVRLASQREYTGNLITAANLNLVASQIYPSTLSNYTFSVTNPDGQLTISGKNTDATPLSAAGKLIVNAPVINQNGVLKAPLGTIELNATSQLSFGSGSLTSVSADKNTIPLGIMAANVWEYPLGPGNNLVFNELPNNKTLGEKHLVFKSPAIDFKLGSTADVSGGGDLFAYEFQPGLGGSNDYLAVTSPSYQGGFAILPSLGSSLTPYDHYLGADFNFDPNAKVYLSGNGALPAGEYTILPAHYALLPGAFLVTPQANTQDQISNSFTKSGLPIITGYEMLAGTHVRDARSTGYLLESSQEVKQHSEYNLKTANNFFASQAALKNTSVPLLPADSGQVSIDATTKLILEGQFNVAAPNARGAKLDISANHIKVVNNLNNSDTSETLEILAQDLSNLHVDSLLLGGTRKFDNAKGTTDLLVAADDVIFDNGISLDSLDLIAVGKNKVEVKSGATLNSSGTVNTGDSKVNIEGDSAFLRVSADNQIILNRPLSTGATGNLVVEQGAVLKASKSMLLNASSSSTLAGDISMQGGSLNLAANNINIGEVNGSHENSLDLSNQKLLGLSVDELILTSGSSINFYGDIGQVEGSGNLAPIHFSSLILDASALSGFENTGKTARLDADALRIQNSNQVKAAQAGTGNGTLELSSKEYSQGKGRLNMDGFNTVNINTSGKFIGVDNSEMKVASNLNLSAGSITTKNGFKLDIDASIDTGHHVNINGNSGVDNLVSSDFGGRVSINANSIALNDAKIVLPSGVLKLQAQRGDILVTGNTDINLAGQAVNFADTLDYTPGGKFNVDAKDGKILLGEETKLDISSGGGKAAGGDLVFKAPNQSVELSGSLKAVGAAASIDVANFSSNAGFDGLMTKLLDAGVSDSLSVRTRHSGIIQAAGNTIKANNINLVADNGLIDIAGSLDANGVFEGGSISLFASDKINLKPGALITAKGDKGGKVLLSSTESTSADHSGINIESVSTIDVGGSSADKGGEVILSALQTGDGAKINIKPITGNIVGYSQLYAQGVKKYSNQALGNDGQLDSQDIDIINREITDYMATASQNIANSLARNDIRLRPGIEIDYDGDLIISSAWDLSALRYGTQADIPGTLSINASGKLEVNSSITDGYQDSKLLNGDSWSFQLVAGADLKSVDKFTTVSNSDLLIGANTSVHSGSGNIKLATGGNFKLTDQTSTVYSAGRADKDKPYGSLDGIQLIDYSLPEEPANRSESLNGEYPIDGGSVQIRVAGDINGALVDETIGKQFITHWLNRQGSINGDFSDENHLTAWAIDAAKFQQNIGSFGGGNVDIAASGNINDLSVMMPTTGKQLGLSFGHSLLDIQGGGQMRVNAGENIRGGIYFLGKGEGNITAAGEIKGSESDTPFALTQGPQIVMSGGQNGVNDGDSKLILNAGQGIKIAAVSDAMILNPDNTKFFSYSDKSKLELKSLSGDVHLNSDTSVVSQILNIGTGFSEQILSSVFPASLDVTAFNGSVQLEKDIILFPSDVSNLNILAKQNIKSNSEQFSIIMSDADRNLLPAFATPIFGQNEKNINFLTATADTFDTTKINAGLVDKNLIHGVIPNHQNDKETARMVAQVGDISSVQINLPKQAIIQAGRDLTNTPIQIQQMNQTDASIISAGRDLIYSTKLDENGNLDRTESDFYKIEVAGPGDVLVQTGRNLDLGSSNGLATVGNLMNTNLSSSGASLDVLVGMNKGRPDYSAFIDKYLVDNPLYADKFSNVKSLITGFMQKRSDNESLQENDALLAFKALTADEILPVQPQLNAFLNQVFFNELKIAGSASAADKSVGNKGGFAAIETLFPENKWHGDLTLLYSTIKTKAGGDINLMIPGGKVNAGLAVAPSGATAKKVDELGIVVQKQGHINAFVKDDFIVNTSRVFTLGGGEIVIWSSEGDIDAGKGAKSALAVTVEPSFFDQNNQLVTPEPTITGGSGIRTAAGPGVKAGDIFLFAPQGVVNAGEAGIAGNNITISATAVLGANNIQVGGVSTGVPVASTGSLAAGLTGTSNLSAGVSQMAENSVSANNGKDRESMMKNALLGLLSVDILGFGE